MLPGMSTPSRLATVLGVPEARAAAVATVLFAAALTADLAAAPAAAYVPLYAACGLVGGWAPARDGLGALRDRRLDVDVLMVVAAIAAAAIGQWRDAGLLIVIFATSGALEELATRRTERSLRDLVALTPERAERVGPDGETAPVAAAELAAGDLVLIRPGARVPADGVVATGVSDLDEAALTGEPLPAAKEPGDEVFGGSVNGAGALTVRITRAAAASVVGRIAALVERATREQAPTQMEIERFEQRYAVGVVVGTVLFVALPLLFLGWEFEEALVRGMTFMIVASPCAVVLATMPALLSAVALAGRNGVLVKGSAALERLARVDTVVLDKTGTLTEGAPVLAGVTPLAGWTRDEVLAVASAAESRSEHPLASAVVAAARESGLTATTPVSVTAVPGRGVDARVGGRRVRVGSRRLLGGVHADAERALAAAEESGATAMAVEVDGRVVGVLAVEDRVRHGARAVVDRLRDLGVERVVLLTGDRPAAARRVAAACGIDEVVADLLPADKAARVSALRADGRRVLAVGDGVNDAPALAAADVSAGMGLGGSALTLETADIVLTADRLTRLPTTLDLAQRARGRVRQNLGLALSAIAVLVGLDIAGRLPLPLGVAGHEGSTVLVALNGLRLLAPGQWRPTRACSSPRRAARRPGDTSAATA